MNLTSPIAEDGGPFAHAPVNGLARSIEQRQLQFYLLQIVVDIAVLVVAFIAAGELYAGRWDTKAFMLPAQLIVPLYLTIALYNRTYSQDSLRSWRAGASRALKAFLVSALLLNFVAFFAQLNKSFSRVGFVLASLFVVLLFIAARRAIYDLSQRVFGPSPLNVLVIEDGGPEVQLRGTYRINAAEHGLVPSLDDPHMLDRFARYVVNMDQVIVSCPDEKRLAWAKVLKGAGVHGEVTSELMNQIGALGVVRRDAIGLATLLVATGPLGFRARVLKRALDIGVSLCALIVALPILALAALAIKLEDGGPILFNQRRIGRRNKLFWEIDERYWHRHSLRPGLTGLAQIRGFRGATDLESDLTGRLQADLEYLAGWTIWRDIAILFATVRVLFHDRAF